MDLNGSQTPLNPNPNAPMIDEDQAEKTDYLPQIHNLENNVLIDCRLVTSPRKDSKTIINENEESKILKNEELTSHTLMTEKKENKKKDFAKPEIPKSERNSEQTEAVHENYKMKKVELKTEPIFNLSPSTTKEQSLSVYFIVLY
jgi:hypothetical protein